jgi:hypothetical protein
MTEELKIKTQREWTKTVTLTPEQVQQMIERKLELLKYNSMGVRRKPACKMDR